MSGRRRLLTSTGQIQERCAACRGQGSVAAYDPTTPLRVSDTTLGEMVAISVPQRLLCCPRCRGTGIVQRFGTSP